MRAFEPVMSFKVPSTISVSSCPHSLQAKKHRSPEELEIGACFRLLAFRADLGDVSHIRERMQTDVYEIWLRVYPEIIRVPDARNLQNFVR